MAILKSGFFPTLSIRMEESAAVRVLAIAGSAGTAGGLFYWHSGAQIDGYPIWLVAGFLYAAAVGTSAVFIFRFLPRLRQFFELTAISRLLLAFTSVGVPELAVALTTSPLLNATMIVVGAVLIRTVSRIDLRRNRRVGAVNPC